MRYLSLFSGIEAATVAWAPLGWHCVAVAEIEPFPCSVLAHRYPHTPNLGDVTKVDESTIALLGPIDLVVFGSPCQDLSVAGKRKGFEDGTRSSLFFVAIDIVRWAREHCGARFALWENVPGAFSSNEGRDFAAVVGHLAGLEHVDVPAHGWGSQGCALGDAGLVEWATLDAQWFGVAQRRRRVFALADFGDWTSRAPILLEPDRVRGDFAPSRGPGEGVAPTIRAGAPNSGRGHGARSDDSKDELIVPVAGTLSARTGGGGGLGTDFDLSGGLQVAFGGNNCSGPIAAAAALNAHGGAGRMDFESETLIAFTAKDYGADAGEVSPTLRSGVHSGSHANGGVMPAIAFNWNAQPDQMRFDEPVTATLTSSQESAALLRSGVRRLTPAECERLQGFPDDYTLVPHRGKPAADGPRYKALGNSMAVPVMRHIGEQIVMAIL